MQSFFIELWGKVCCPLKHLQVQMQKSVNQHMMACIERMLRYCIQNGYEVRICIMMPPDSDRKQRIEMQTELARPFGRSCDDWETSEHSALRLINSLSPQQQDVVFRIPFMSTNEIANDIPLPYCTVRKCEGIIHKKLRCSKKEEITAMLIAAGFFSASQIMKGSDFFNAVRHHLHEAA